MVSVVKPSHGSETITVRQATFKAHAQDVSLIYCPARMNSQVKWFVDNHLQESMERYKLGPILQRLDGPIKPEIRFERLQSRELLPLS
jgi:hypothetical protein